MKNCSKIIVTLLALLSGEQGLFASTKPPFWTSGYYMEATYSYVEVVSATGGDYVNALDNASNEIIKRRSLATGTNAHVSNDGDFFYVESNHDLIVTAKIIDHYVECIGQNMYKAYLLVHTAKNPIFGLNAESVSISDKYPFSGKYFIPGWGQIYKGSKTKGGLIIAGEAIGVGGIVLSYSMKSSWEKLMQEDPKHIKEYSLNADMWQNITYGSIAFTAAIYIYNLIDAAVAPGARRVIVLPRQQTMTLAPTVTMDGSVGIAMRYNF